MTSQHSQYLESKVLTAPPQRLHLMLIEGAIRFGRQAEQELDAGNHAAATGPLIRVLDIVGELLVGVRKTQSELNDKLASVYWFIFRRVSEATMDADAAALAEVLQLLEFERETWQKVCEKLSPNSGSPATVPPPSHAFGAAQSTMPISGISLQA
jgi:flagellar protein FliS